MNIESLKGIVHSDAAIMGGTPVFVGTRVPLQNLIDCLEGGESIEDFLDGFPSVSRLPYHLQVRMRGEQRPQSFTDKGVVFDDHYTPFFTSGHDSLQTRQILSGLLLTIEG